MINEETVNNSRFGVVEPVDVDSEGAKLTRSTRSNAGTGVKTYKPTMSGKEYEKIKEICGPGHKAKLNAFQFIQKARKKNSKTSDNE